MSRLTDWLKKQATTIESTLLPKSAAARTDAAAAPPSVASKNLLGTTAHGMNELVADEVLGAGGYAAPSVAAAAPVSAAIATRSSDAAISTLEAAEGGRSFASIHAARRPADAPKPKSYEEHLLGDGGHVPAEARGQVR